MASFQASTFLVFSSTSSSSKQIRAALSVPKIPSIKFSVPKVVQTKGLSLDLNTRDQIEKNVIRTPLVKETSSVSMSTIQLYAVLESIADRVEMHNNVGQQTKNWNSLLLNSINMITLAAATMAGLTATGGGGVSVLGLQLASTLLFSAATGMLVMMNKIQPSQSQLLEEQRNATRLFKQLKRQIETLLAIGSPSKEDVEEAMEKVLALDKAYPLPLMGVMLEKFPETLEPAVWWPKTQSKKTNKEKHFSENVRNGWTKELEMEMREPVEVIKRKDREEYERLGNMFLFIFKRFYIF